MSMQNCHLGLLIAAFLALVAAIVPNYFKFGQLEQIAIVFGLVIVAAIAGHAGWVCYKASKLPR
jgi:xanthine/uracil permease